MGFGVALTGPASSSILADMFPESSRGTAFGLMYFISGLGADYWLFSLPQSPVVRIGLLMTKEGVPTVLLWVGVDI